MMTLIWYPKCSTCQKAKKKLEELGASFETRDIVTQTPTAEELREAFGLRSACFTLDTSGGEFQFTVKGWGHGVGMSQAGAAFLANQGASYQEILAHYYPGALLEGAA